jgi:hypothetical protein
VDDKERVKDREKDREKEKERQKEGEREGLKEGGQTGEKESPILGLSSGIRGPESFTCRVGCISLLTQLISRYVTSSSSSSSAAHSSPPVRSSPDSGNNENGANENVEMEYDCNDEHYDPRYEKMKRLHLFRKYGGDVMFVTLITDSDTRTLDKRTQEYVRASTEHSTDTDSGGVGTGMGTGTGSKGVESLTPGPSSVQRPIVHLPLSDRHFALWVLRETVVGAGEEGVGREMTGLLSCLLWLLGCPTSHTHTLQKSCSPSPSPTLTPPQQPISSTPTAEPYTIPDYLFSASSLGAGSRTEIPLSLSTADHPVISVFLKILILQEIRLLLWGNDAKPLIPEGNPSKNIRLPLLDSFVPNTLDTSSHTNQSSNSLHSSLFFFRPKKDEPLAFQGPKGPSETPLLSSSLGNICVSNYPTKRALISLGSIETLLCMIIGEFCPHPIKEIFRKHVRTNVLCVRDAAKIPTKGNLTECEVEMWWSALSTLGHLCAGCDEAKETVDRCLGEGVFIRALLPLANTTPRESDTPGGLYSEGKEGRRRPRPLSVSTGLECTVPTCSVIISQLLLEMCVGGEAGRISTPSRPFIAITTAAPPASTSLSSSTSSSYLSADTMSHLGSYALPSSLSAHFSYPFSGVISTPKHPFPLPTQNPENTPTVPLSETASGATTSFSSSTVESENVPLKKDENLPLPSTLTLKQHLSRPSIAFHLSFTNFSNALNSKENYSNQENVRYSKYGHCSDYYNSPIDTDVEIFGKESVPLPPLSALSPFYYVHEESLAQFQACLEPVTLSCTYDCFGLYFCTGERDVTDDLESLIDSPRARGMSGGGLSGLSGVGVGTGTGLGSGRREQTTQNPSTPASNTPSSSIFNIFSSKKESRSIPGGSNPNPVPANSIRKRGSFSANLSSNSLNTITPSNLLGARVGSYRNMSDENRWENDSLKGSVTGRTGGKKSSHQTPSLVTLRQVLSSSEYSSPHIFSPDENGPRKMSVGSASASVSVSGFEDFNMGHSHNNYTPNQSSSTSNVPGLKRSGNSGLLGTNMGSNYGSKSRGTRGSVASSTNNSTHGFGNSTHGFGNSTHGFGNSTHGFGNSTHGFGNSTHGFGNSTHGFGPSPGYGLGLLGAENVETASICSEINRNPVKSDASTGYCNVYVPLFAVLEDGLGHSDSSASVLCLLHSALLLKSGLFHTVEPAEEDACADSLLDYDEAEERDSLVDNESIASGTSYWGQNKGFGSSFFAAVVGAGTSWISGGKGPEKWGPGPGPLSSQLLLENNESGRNVHNNVPYGAHNSGLPNGRVRSSTYLSQQWEPSVKGNSICGDEPPAGENSLLYIRRRNSGFSGVLGDSMGKENVVVGLSSLSAELQLQSLKRQLLRFLPPPPIISPQELAVPVGSKVRSGNFFTLFSSRSPVRYALKSLLGGTATNTKFENTDLLKKPLFQDSFTSAWSPSFSRLKIRSLECAKILLAFSCGEKSTVQSIFLAAFSNLVDGNPENGALLTSDATFVVSLMETLLGIERDKGGGTGTGSGTWPVGGGSGPGPGTGGVILAEDPASNGRTGSGPSLQRRKTNGSGLSHLLSQILRYNVTEVRMEFKFWFWFLFVLLF